MKTIDGRQALADAKCEAGRLKSIERFLNVGLAEPPNDLFMH